MRILYNNRSFNARNFDAKLEVKLCTKKSKSFFWKIQETINYYWSFLTKAYYLFGLGLRQDVLGVLMG